MYNVGASWDREVALLEILTFARVAIEEPLTEECIFRAKNILFQLAREDIINLLCHDSSPACFKILLELHELVAIVLIVWSEDTMTSMFQSCTA